MIHETSEPQVRNESIDVEAIQIDGHYVLVEEANDHRWIAAKEPAEVRE